MFAFVEKTLKLIDCRDEVLMDESTVDDVKITQDRAFGIDTGDANEKRMIRSTFQLENVEGIGLNDRLRPLIEGNRCVARVVEHVMLENKSKHHIPTMTDRHHQRSREMFIPKGVRHTEQD